MKFSYFWASENVELIFVLCFFNCIGDVLECLGKLELVCNQKKPKKIESLLQKCT
jgi:hypothetical protein